jgi:isopenicillin N synthase-like dioxygenase
MCNNHKRLLSKLPWFEQKDVPDCLPILSLNSMQNELLQGIPIQTGTTRHKLKQNLLNGHGLIYIKDHGICESELQVLSDTTRGLLLNPNTEFDHFKSKLVRGYVAFGEENHGVAVGKGNLPDLCMKYTWGEYANVYPNVDFKKIWDNYFTKIKHLSSVLLGHIAATMELEGKQKKAFSAASNGLGMLRYLHYPDINENVGGVDKERLVNHTDMGLLTILYQTPSLDSHIALEVKTDQGYIGVPAVRNTLIVNAGEMLSHLFCREIKAAEHRVVLPTSNSRGISCERDSIAFFLDPDPDVEINPSDIYGASLTEQANDLSFKQFFAQVEANIRGKDNVKALTAL